MPSHKRQHRQRQLGLDRRLRKRLVAPVLVMAVVGAGAGGIAASSGWALSRGHGRQQVADGAPGQPRTESAPVSRAGGPTRAGFLDISKAPRAKAGSDGGEGASTGTFTARCGRNENAHHNSDNFIVAPGVSNGAHHVHDYVGNLSADADSTDKTLAAAGTTCTKDDKSAYFWPVLRLREDGAGRSGASSGAPDSKDDSKGRTSADGNPSVDGNVGRILTPSQVKVRFRGNAGGPVSAMPRFLRAVTGDAKAYTNGSKNVRANWTCTGFLNRRLVERYPRCPAGSQVLRILDFPSCWDGVNTDSANHRRHLAFPGPGGICPKGTEAVPQLRITLAYDVPPGAPIAVDTFPEQRHKPQTDHADFVNVMPRRLMDTVVDCINRDRTCS